MYSGLYHKRIAHSCRTVKDTMTDVLVNWTPVVDMLNGVVGIFAPLLSIMIAVVPLILLGSVIGLVTRTPPHKVLFWPMGSSMTLSRASRATSDRGTKPGISLLYRPMNTTAGA